MCNMRLLLCRRWQVICWPWWWQVHAQVAGWDIQPHVRVGCVALWIWCIVLYKRASASLPVTVCCWALRARPPTSMMKSRAAVVWHGQTGNRIHRGSAKMDADHITPPQSSAVCGWKQQSYGMRAKAPLRAIKYSSAIRQRALGSIPTASCNKPPKEKNNNNFPWKQQQQQQSADAAETEETALIMFDLTPDNTDSVLVEPRAIYKPLNTPTTSITNLLFDWHNT